ncbi:uncharacterized protein GGS22DRAFT_168519 [Annulohypoxylon maeteangense]|uniref:uncharacterized protein n=1 Tax=Annulohypoxylon maeteangense TaxID=1927788 RepID=UPI0020075188|nr:uncharacterized protein GGS22DRAFT_168519 [Annulohypoxylon maeteangense]KAI0882691.1 hypothetical protein GGS22DRAFT_168519 [Annulohypoxylon maeteangense]
MVKDNNEQGMPEDIKGKGIAIHPNNLSSSSAHRDGRSDSAQVGNHKTSIMSRIGASASKLTGDMVLRHPSSTQIARALPSSKAESSGATEARSIQEASPYKNCTNPTNFGGTFKSTQSQGQPASHESSFSSFLVKTSVPDMIEPSNVESHAYRRGYDSESRQVPQTSAIAATDGMCVASLLDTGYDEVDETVAPLTDDERVSLRYHLFEDDSDLKPFSSQRGQWKDILNFFPDFSANSNSTQELAELLGLSDPEEARRIWTNQWQCVLSSYTDEVWGHLSPLVNVAREELSSLSKPAEDLPLKPKALHRLQQILSHVRGM